MFTTKPEHYRKNVRQGRDTNARPATLTTYSGIQRPAVVLYCKGTIYGVLPLDDALRLANQIADAIATHKTGDTKPKEGTE